ncbi:uncharacterized protein GGS22DRAFT_152667 [Annulohypoxylon maeteangense]|uniref:uncharacterized protein n=1 Tax=Annulohypoxylon maeteangense TaxID=1927788 RepID=UPI0020084323|nr:uncharacterized protein GGS22DRAFT_152667 [Annulohypoxylon maeteangense]KAI0888905.1 hypothetical protein GGS22DRAFT_152667 [Annulohypoxylon maeteangense]
MSNQTPPQLADVYKDMEGYVGPTYWARPYFSNHHHENPGDMRMLGHVNCGYLSTAGRPPTLEALKQHAQSLAYLISTIVPSIASGEVDGANNGAEMSFFRNTAYDWLDDMQKPYDNIDRAHRKPLNSLVNLVKRNSDERGIEFHCPLSETPVQHIEHDLEPVRPFQSHLTLLMHANECLEKLDHDFSAMGGLLALLPTEEEDLNTNPDLPKARKTLIGEWLMFTQHLVGRMHELEIAYANAVDLLANEAIVPAQHLSNTGPDGRAGREIVFPQDRWILANAGEDVFNFVHQMLDKKEAWGVNRDNVFSRQNVVGNALRRPPQEGEEQAGEDFLKGVAYVDLSTRYYRLKGSGHGPVFCLPAFADRPNTAYTKEIENRPTVVTVPQPTLPTQTTAWERRRQELQTEHTNMFNQLTKAQNETTRLTISATAHEEELKRLRHLNQIYENNQDSDATQLAQRIAELEAERDAAQTQYNDNNLEMRSLRDQLEEYRARTVIEQQPPSGVSRRNDMYTMNPATFREYSSRSAAVAAVKPEIERSKAALQELADKGELDMSNFAWLDTIAGAA